MCDGVCCLLLVVCKSLLPADCCSWFAVWWSALSCAMCCVLWNVSCWLFLLFSALFVVDGCC